MKFLVAAVLSFVALFAASARADATWWKYHQGSKAMKGGIKYFTGSMLRVMMELSAFRHLRTVEPLDLETREAGAAGLALTSNLLTAAVAVAVFLRT